MKAAVHTQVLAWICCGRASHEVRVPAPWYASVKGETESALSPKRTTGTPIKARERQGCRLLSIPRTVLIAASLAGASVLLSGCATAESQSTAPIETLSAQVPSSPAVPPRMGPVTRPETSGDLHRPIDKYLLAPAQSYRLLEAETARINHCVGRAASESTAPSAASKAAVLNFLTTQQSDDVQRSSLWGFFDPSNAAVVGYARSPGVIASIEIRAPAGVPQETYRACSRAADDALPTSNGLNALFSGIPEALPGGGPFVPATDSRYRKAERAWIACMQTRNYSYRSARAPLDDSQLLAAGERAQIAAATADVRCKLETNLVGIGLAVQSAYDRAYIASHRQALRAFKSKVEAYIQDAT
jgi:hypothetical protein